MKVICVPSSKLKEYRSKDALTYVLYGHSSQNAVGEVGASLPTALFRAGVVPVPRAWDLLSIALAAIAADDGCLRKESPDGWTRTIDLTIAVTDIRFWSTQKTAIESALRFLTGDIWTVSLVEGETPVMPEDEVTAPDADIVCLLSGGLDSLTGAIDLTGSQVKPVLVSQVSKGDKDKQQKFAASIQGGLPHIQLNHNVRSPYTSERSQRARSLIFLAYGVAVASSLRAYGKEIVELRVPENGFISLNLPLTPLRIGSLSTRTTHPIFMRAVQSLLNAAGLMVRLNNPYQFMTKGEILTSCGDQTLLGKLAFETTSCGRFARTGFEHCGRCVPCLVRRAAIEHWRQEDRTSYRYDDLSINDARHRKFTDVRDAAMAVEHVRLRGLDAWIGGSLNTAQIGANIASYRDVAERGIQELGAFLKVAGVL